MILFIYDTRPYGRVEEVPTDWEDIPPDRVLDTCPLKGRHFYILEG